MATFIFAGGGSAGHALPSILVAKHMLNLGHDVFFLGTHDSIESQLCSNEEIPFYPISTGKFNRANKLSIVTASIRTLIGLIQACAILLRLQPSGVFSSGGFASVPVIFASYILRIPKIITHACDFSLGLANKICLPMSTHLTCAFNETCFGIKKGVFVGPIVNKTNISNASDILHKQGKYKLLIYGGSLGSKIINEKVRHSLRDLLKEYDILHICGKNNLDPSFEGIAGYNQHEYILNFQEALRSSHIAICRAGAGSLWELIFNKIPHLAIPLPLSVSRGDQIENCKYFEKRGATCWLHQDDFIKSSLASILTNILNKRETIIKNMDIITPARPAIRTISEILNPLTKN